MTINTNSNTSAKVVTAKAVNYTVEQTAQAIEMYKTGDSVDVIAKALGKGTKSIVAKLVREGVYEKKAYITKSGAKPVSKEAHVATIAAFLGVPADTLESLEKANKRVLQLIEAFVQKTAQDFDNQASGA